MWGILKLTDKGLTVHNSDRKRKKQTYRQRQTEKETNGKGTEIEENKTLR